MTKESRLSIRAKKLIKSVSARTFYEEGYPPGVNPGMTSPVPRWFVELREAGRIRVNCMCDATIYLRDDGHLFCVQEIYGYVPMPMAAAGIDDIDAFRKNIFISENAPISPEGVIWETSEHVPDSSCEDRRSLWKVAANCRRSGRFLYTAKRKTVKQYLEGPDEYIPWIYSEQFDQFTEAYEKRYQERIMRTAAEREERAEKSRKNARRVEFNFDFNDSIVEKPSIDHFSILGISEKSGPREVKRAYWSLARQYHPDLNPNNSEAEEKFKRISVSYQELMRQFN
jgi:hypothetical protein